MHCSHRALLFIEQRSKEPLVLVLITSSTEQPVNMDQIMVEVKKIPPVTKFLCASSLVVTFRVILNMLPLHNVLFMPSLTFGKLRLWTLHTSFFLGRTDLYYIVEFFMLYRSANDLESKSYFNRSSDLAWQLFWACWCIIPADAPRRPVRTRNAAKRGLEFVADPEFANGAKRPKPTWTTELVPRQPR
ncbi:hypothetical protein D9613_008729 [Agrocybe pediades]|uniref:Derlin n=1 Tax=Agrocybe pediades TaxID=84607 RepID=A0A8H4QU90_9AGAR|nr:hypothetical protein D9613_008729 [Agrocybe pediades]